MSTTTNSEINIFQNLHNNIININSSNSAAVLSILPQLKRLAVLSKHITAPPDPLYYKNRRYHHNLKESTIINIDTTPTTNLAMIPLPGTLQYTTWLDDLKIINQNVFTTWLVGFHKGRVTYRNAMRRLAVLSRHVNSNAYYMDVE
jgi:hypothetical protein